MNTGATSITDVLSGNAPVKAEVSINTQSIVWLCVGLAFVLAIAAVLFHHKQNEEK